MQKEMKEIVKNLKAQLEAQQERAMLQSQEELAVYHHNELVERDGVISRLKDELKSAERNLESCKRHRDSLQDELNNEREKSAREFHQRCLLESRLQSASLDAENSNKNFGMIKSQLLQEIEQLKMGRRQEAAEFEEQLTEIAEKMTASAKQWNSERGMLKDEISSVKKENQILIKAKMEVEEALKAAAEKEAQLQNTILEIEDRLNLFALQRQQDLRDAERKTEELSELVAKTRDRNHEMSEELKDFQNIARAQKAEISSLRMSLQDESVRNQSEKKNLLGQVNALKDQILKSKNLLEESMHDTKQLANEKVEMSAEIEFEKKRRRDAESQSNSLKKAIEETKSQIDQLRLANQKQKEENLELKKHEESYRKSIKSLKAELERQCVLTDKLREEMLVQQNKDADNQNQLNILRKKLESLSKQKTEMKSEREQEQEQMQLHMSRMEEKEKSLSSRIVELEQQESNLMRMVEGLRNDTAAAEDEVKAVRAEMSEKQQTFSEVEKALQARLLKSHKLVEEVETSPAQERILKFEAEAKCRRLQEELDDLTTLLHVKHIKNRNGEVVDLEDGDVRRAAQNRSGSGEHEASMSGGWMMSSPPAGTKSVTFSSQLEPSSVKSLREEFSSFLSSEGIEPSRSKKSSVTSVSSFMANAHKEIRR
uniref:Uncharacterized protein n=1 Tax=Hanusia phi TaxID=3032 RepID=A0A7S0F5L7_9CRYP